MTPTKFVRPIIRFLIAAGLAACATQQQSAATDTSERRQDGATVNQLSDADRAAGWRLLFDGRTLTGWRVYQSQSQPNGWQARDGTLMKAKETDDIVSVDQFGDFELALEWRIAQGGNAGIFYRATEEYEKVYWSAVEYQLLDDSTGAGSDSRLTSAGSAYGLYPSPAGALRRGEWNAARIVVRGSHVEHWLNGTKLLEYDYGSPGWEAKIKASKFVDWPNFGRAKRGHIAIQGDHAGELALRNIRIREI